MNNNKNCLSKKRSTKKQTMKRKERNTNMQNVSSKGTVRSKQRNKPMKSRKKKTSGRARGMMNI